MVGVPSDLATTRDRYLTAVLDTNRELAWGAVHAALDAGATPEQIVFEVVIPAVERMLTLMTHEGEANLAQHYVASRTAEEVTDAMLERFDARPPQRGTIVIGSARGDFHGLGKKIVSGILRANLFQVRDLGLNVPAERFVEVAQDEKARVIGVSSMMMHTATGPGGPRRVRELLEARGLSGQIHLVVGGAPYRFDAELYREVGADAWAENALTAVSVMARVVDGGTA